MAKRTVVVEPEKTLHRKARPQEKFDENLKILATDMLETMHEADGVGLAAPQIGILRQIFTMNVCPSEVDPCGQPAEVILNVADDSRVAAENTAPGDLNLELFDEDIPNVENDRDYVLINPKIIAKRGCQFQTEGCLSLPGIFGSVYRPFEVVVEYLNLQGETCRLHGSGLQAACICHETDHLNGLMFYQRVPDDLYRIVDQEFKPLTTEERHKLGI